ncbi:MAG: isopentenyl phosphate kinase family protein [Anaerolineaceae bacterium]|nr:isopentenyl phosphate kinase family protein [Anaerolineaceae bacterium]
MLTLVKLGGSLITDKRVEASFRQEAAAQIAQEISRARQENPELQLIIGHGSGSFGHFVAKQHQTIAGVHTPEQWRGFAEVATVAAELNYLVARELSAAGVPVWRMQPSASALSRDGVLVNLALEPLQQGVEHGLVPLVYGDVALDTVRGGTIISTETIFFYLAKQLPVTRILLLGEVEGVLDSAGEVIPTITPANFADIRGFLGGSAGTDVTGGMTTKVQDMLSLAEQVPELTIRIMDGRQPDLLYKTLLDIAKPGTLIIG